MTHATDSLGVRRLLGLSACVALVGAVSLVGGAHPAPADINVWTSHGPERGVAQALAVDPVS